MNFNPFYLTLIGVCAYYCLTFKKTTAMYKQLAVFVLMMIGRAGVPAFR